MDNKDFNNVLRICMEKNGFILKNKGYYKTTDDLIVVVEAQKSNYDNSYYVNYAFFVKDIYTGVNYPKTNVGDIRGRFSYELDDVIHDSFPLIDISQDELDVLLNNNINNILKPVINNGIGKYFEMFPKARYTATRKLQHYLENYDTQNNKKPIL